MAKFVIAGKADCPYYSKAELLADQLQVSLPNFKIHKICIHPDEWTEWLRNTCETNGWEHQQSPLIWRELTERGGKGLILGGYNDFSEYCQEYYGIKLDMSTDKIVEIAAENLEAKLAQIEEEKMYASLIQPFHIWISSALHPTSYSLIPHLLSREVFPDTSALCLHLLHVGGDAEELQGLKMEVEDLAMPLLLQVTVHVALEEAFQSSDVIILIDSDAGGMDLSTTVDRYRDYGQLIDRRAHREVMVVVAGDLLVNLRCSLLVENAPSIDSHRFVAIGTQLASAARADVAEKLSVRSSDVIGVSVWGNISGSFHVDLQRARVFDCGAVKGPAFFSRPVLEVLRDRKWLKTDFQRLVTDRRAAVASKTGRTVSLSAVNSILAVLKAWNGLCSPDELFSLGLQRPGQYRGLRQVICVPAVFRDGWWSELRDVEVGEELMEKLRLCAYELRSSREEPAAACTTLDAEDIPDELRPSQEEPASTTLDAEDIPDELMPSQEEPASTTLDAEDIPDELRPSQEEPASTTLDAEDIPDELRPSQEEPASTTLNAEDIPDELRPSQEEPASTTLDAEDIPDELMPSQDGPASTTLNAEDITDECS